MVRTIAVGVDGTASSRHALEWAADYAAQLDAEVVAVFAMRPLAELVISIPPMPVDAGEQLKEAFEHQWCRPLEESGVRYRTVMVEDNPVHALCATAQREHCDLLVVGVHGHGGLAGRVLGGTSYRVSHRAPCPVVVIGSEVPVGSGIEV